ncbi:MAG: 30S ribosomal protein S6e [Candidatus Micrarchaeota archaeon]|nr:30S ribosomal protein S6e [Candidatus Micrarchaeota archaeon]
MKVVISDPKTGKSYQLELKKEADYFLGKKIGQQIDGSLIGLAGYILEIRGGSDFSGFPMRPDLDGSQRKSLLLAKGPGYRPKEKGVRKRKTIVGNTISPDIVQVNCIISSYGPKPIEELIPQTKKEEKK